jgi:predicted CXXCH cytochrome family protein
MFEGCRGNCKAEPCDARGQAVLNLRHFTKHLPYRGKVRWPALLALVTAFALACIGMLRKPVAAASLPQKPALDDRDRACAKCHKNIYERCKRTPMARGSGIASDGLIEGGFTHAASGIRYKLIQRDGQAWMIYDRTVPGTGPALHGEQLLSYYVGSGRRGRTYLFERDGWWFEAPVNYYSKKQLWDMAPNYGSVQSMPDTLPVDSNCLHCHAGEVQTALPDARNKYAVAPFMAGGVTCAACHGDPAQHLAQQGHGPIVNPAALSPAKRDSICLQCHLEGEAAIYRAGKSLAAYQPGDDLARYVVYFVNANHQEGGGRASSQYEALLKSACKRASGDRLTCTTCHDPHDSPAATQRVSFYRDKCLTCHTGQKMATEHHPEQQDCAVCHMPTRETTDISHEQLTDHNIQKLPQKDRSTVIGQTAELVPVGGVSAGDRELGLAYVQLAERGDRQSGERALSLLKKAENEGAKDVELHVRLGFLDQISGKLANLAVLDASQGHTDLAVRLLEKVVAADPAQTAAGLDLAFLECRLGDQAKAMQTIAEVQRFNPDSASLHQFLATGKYGDQYCRLRR